MKNTDVKQLIINDLVKQGFNFNRSPFELSTSESLLLESLAKGVKYRPPKNCYFSRGRAFYAHLQNIYRANK